MMRSVRPILALGPLAWASLMVLAAGSPLRADPPPVLAPGAVAGARVVVKGSWRRPGVLRAEELRIAGGDGASARLHGTIDALDLAGGSLRIGGITVNLEPATTVQRAEGSVGALSDLVQGMYVRLRGLEGPAASLTAREIEITGRRSNSIRIEAVVRGREEVGKGRVRLQLCGVPVEVTTRTRVQEVQSRGGGGEGASIPDDDEVSTTHRPQLGRAFTLGGRVLATYEPGANFDLNPASAGDDVASALSLQVELATLGDSPVGALFRLRGQKGLALVEEDGEDVDPSRVELRRGYLSIPRIGSSRLGMILGRQPFDEAREWVYHRDLDAFRLLVDWARIRWEVSAGGDFLGSSPREKDIADYALYASAPFPREGTLAGYFLLRDDNGRPFLKRHWWGLRSQGEPLPGLSYWGEAALLRGATNGASLSGYAFDLGEVYVFPHPLQPSIVAGYAFGSGDRTLRDGRDGGFRQTGLQRNRDRFNGVASFRYYGELLRPELANLRIVTAGTGLRPTPRSSLDLVYHAYRQVVADNRIHGSRLLLDPLGMWKDVGEEWDLIAGVEGIWEFDLRGVFAVFRPGRAFPTWARPATYARLQVDYDF